MTNPLNIQPGELWAAEDERGKRYCVFLKRLCDPEDGGRSYGWLILSLAEKRTLQLPDADFATLVRTRRFERIERAGT
jgi:hypothetical protein